MGKFLVGCVVVIFVLGVGGAGVGYFFFIKPAWDSGQEAMAMIQEFEELESEIENRESYEPAEDQRLEEEQFESFLAVQRAMRDSLEGRFTELQEQYEELQSEIDAEERDPSLRELAGAYRDLGDLLLQARRSQVDALNEQQLSPEEYNWIREQVYGALGQSVAVGMGEAGEEQRPDIDHQVHPDTVDMVRAYQDELEEGHVLAWWGF